MQTKEDNNIIDSISGENVYLFGGLIKSIEHGLSEVIRWRKYTIDGAEIENDLQHSYSASLLAVLVIEAFESEGWHLGGDAYRILACTLIHDIGEIGIGDTHYIDKTAKKDMDEIRSFKQTTDCLPINIKNRILDIFLIQFMSDNSRISHDIELKEELNDRNNLGYKHIGRTNVRIFEAIERYGYLLYAFHNYKNRKDHSSKKLLVQVIRNQHNDLCRIADEFWPFKKHFYPDVLQNKIIALLGIYKDSIEIEQAVGKSE